jgi:3-oxoacyl-[acyl-carrier protein] reductase
VAVIDVNAAGAEAAAQQIRDAGGQAWAWALDVSDAAAVARVVNEAAATLGGLDSLVNNAGISVHRPIAQADYAQAWERALAVMLTGPQQMVRAALPHLRQSDAARIVNIASTEALGATAGYSPYAAAKAGVIALTQSAALEYGPRIRVNCVSPGLIRTPLSEGLFRIPGLIEPLLDALPAGRAGTADEVADAVVFLCSPQAAFITGANLVIDGGQSLVGGGIDAVMRGLLARVPAAAPAAGARPGVDRERRQP